MLFSILAFFAVIIAANLVMMGFALKTHTGLVVPNSYVASQDFNKEIAAARAQTALGWRTTFAYEGGALRQTFAGPTGAPLAGLDVSAAIGRPVTDADDRTLAYTEIAPGVYGAEAALPPGIWRIETLARSTDGKTYREIREIDVRAPEK